MRDTRPINMLILTVFMIALLGVVAAVGSMRWSQTAVEMPPAAINDNVNYESVGSAQASDIRPQVMRVFQTLTTLLAQVCQAAPQTSPVQLADGRYGMHSLTIQPLAAICSLYMAQ